MPLAQKDERARPEAGLRKKAATLASVILVCALAVGALFGDRGLFQLMRQRQQAATLEQQLQELRAENARLAAEIVSLRTDPRAIERLAREQLGLVRPGETVFVIRDEDAGH